MSKYKTFKSRFVQLKVGAGKLLAFPRSRWDGTHTRVDAEENPKRPGFLTPHTKDPKRRPLYDFVEIPCAELKAWNKRIEFDAGLDWLLNTQPVVQREGVRWLVTIPRQHALFELVRRHFGGVSDFTPAHLIAFYKDARRALRRGTLLDVITTKDLERLECIGTVAWSASCGGFVIYRSPLFASRVDADGSEEQFTLRYYSGGLLWHASGWFATPLAHPRSLFARVIAPTLGPRFRDGLQRLLSIFPVRLDWSRFDQSVAEAVAAGPPPNIIAREQWCSAIDSSKPPDEPAGVRLAWRLRLEGSGLRYRHPTTATPPT